MNIPTAMLSLMRASLVANYTSVGYRMAETYTKASDGSDVRTYTQTGSSFPCNIQPLQGDKTPQPIGQLDVKKFRLFVPYNESFNIQDQVQVDGYMYVIKDIDDRRGGSQVSRTCTVSAIHP